MMVPVAVIVYYTGNTVYESTGRIVQADLLESGRARAPLPAKRGRAGEGL
jgi:hypothetical protein